MAHRYAACTQGIPVHNIKASRCRTVPHGGFAAVQDDDHGWRVVPVREMHWFMRRSDHLPTLPPAERWHSLLDKG